MTKKLKKEYENLDKNNFDQVCDLVDRIIQDIWITSTTIKRFNMKYTDPPYSCDYLNFFIEKIENPINQKTKDYVVAFHPRNGFFEEPVLSREDLKGLADFIYKTIGEKKFAGLRNGKIVEFSNDRLDLNHDHIDQIIEIQLDKDQ